MRDCITPLVILALVSVGWSQECERGIVGFTALTPEQLREEIRNSLRAAVTETPPASSDNGVDICFAALESINATLEDLGLFRDDIAKSIVDAVTEKVESSITSIVEKVVSENMKSIVENLTTVFQSVRPSVAPDVVAPTVEAPTVQPLPPSTRGITRFNAATSCQEIHRNNPSLPSGRYWISQDELPVQVYCDMTRSCGGVTGGWMQVANIDMTVANNPCPAGFTERVRDTAPKRLCVADDTGPGCFSSMFSVRGISYGHVCGRIIGYQNSTPNAFFPFQTDQRLTINDIVIDGVMLTHGKEPRRHIWSFVAALDETEGHLSGCPCSNTDSERTSSIPPFVGNDYFCDTASEGEVEFRFYDEDPLWDGKGCGAPNVCCSFNNPPWFSKELPSRSRDDIEMRVCRDAGHRNEDTPLEIIELYVQ